MPQHCARPGRRTGRARTATEARPGRPRPTAPETRRRALAADAPVRAPAARSAAAGQSTLPAASTPAARGRPRGHGPAPPPQSGHAASPRCPEPRTFQLSSGRFFHPKALCPHPRAATPAVIQPLNLGLAGAGGLRPLGPSLRGWGQLLRGGPWHWLPLLVCSRVGSQGCTLPRGRPGCHVGAGSGTCRLEPKPQDREALIQGTTCNRRPSENRFPRWPREGSAGSGVRAQGGAVGSAGSRVPAAESGRRVRAQGGAVGSHPAPCSRHGGGRRGRRELGGRASRLLGPTGKQPAVRRGRW